MIQYLKGQGISARVCHVLIATNVMCASVGFEFFSGLFECQNCVMW
jgi:hypothetical protein